MTLHRFVFSARERLGAIYPKEEARGIVNVLTREFFGIEGYRVHVDGEKELDDGAVVCAESALCRLEKHEPLQYVLGHAEFCGRRYAVNPAVLIPRPETETLCRHAMEYAARLTHPARVLDLCTGSGCIAWTMAAELMQVVGIDISPEAIAVAESQEIHGPAGMVAPIFHIADIFDDTALDSILSRYGKFDLVLSNPPYVLQSESVAMRRNVLDYEPHSALFVPDSDPMLFNRKIVEIFEKHSYMESALFIEINENEGAETERIVRNTGRMDALVLDDCLGRNRVVKVCRKTS